MLISRVISLFPARPLFHFARLRKDYYAILGIEKTATFEQIKQAYAQKASKIYPDVHTIVQAGPENAAQDFQDVAEAYAVLSNLQSRNSYDLLNKEQPELLYSQARTQVQTESQPEQIISSAPGVMAAQFAREKEIYLKKEREVFNADQFGRYRGGLPQPKKGSVRGNAIGTPGTYHRPYIHNVRQEPFEQEAVVTSETVEAFKIWSNEERIGKEWQYLYQVAEVDYEYFKFNEYRTYLRWFRNLFILGVGLPLLLKTMAQTKQRYLLQEIQERLDEGLPVIGEVINGKKIALGPTGALRVQDASAHDAGHH